MLDWLGQVAGEAEYTPFGLPNRVTYLSDTAHPNNAADDKKVLGFFKQPHPSNEHVRLRARFSMLDTAPGNSVELANASSAALSGTSMSGAHANSFLTDAEGGNSLVGPWAEVPEDGLLQLRFRGPASTTFSGATLSGYDYQRYQTGSVPTWTRLGFPGQYFDPETDLFENWHRFYDPNTGRYLEPDPIWKYRNTWSRVSHPATSTRSMRMVGTTQYRALTPQALLQMARLAVARCPKT